MHHNEKAIMRKAGSSVASNKLYKLTIGGGGAFWAANFAISLTPMAAEYRAALSIAYFPMLLESLLGGLMIGFCVSYFLLCFFDQIPIHNPIQKSVILSFILLITVTILIGGPSSLLTPGDPWRYFLIGVWFNALRILSLGIGIGFLYGRLHKEFNPPVIASGAANTATKDRLVLDGPSQRNDPTVYQEQG